MNEDFSAEERLLVRGEEVQAESLRSLQGWYPVVIRDGKLWWRLFGEKRFSEPFFFDSVASLPPGERYSLQTSFDALDNIGDALEPTAFIFHVSRCGSTLLTQMLAGMPGCVVMSEPVAVDSFLRFHHTHPERSGAEQTLRKIVRALGQKRSAHERHLFIKLDSWHIESLPLLRRAFPATPLLFLYRQPGAVLASHRRQRGRQMVPGMVNAAMPSFECCGLAPGDLDGYSERVLEHFFKQGLLHADELMLVNYSQLPAIVWSDLLPRFSVAASDGEIAAMQSRATFHSKHTTRFGGDPQAGICDLCDPDYNRLEQLRLQRQPAK